MGLLSKSRLFCSEKRLVFMSLIIFSVFSQELFAKNYTIYHKNFKEETSSYWRLDPYSLDQWCAFYLLNTDDEVFQRSLQKILPNKLSRDESILLAQSVVGSGSLGYIFSHDEIMNIKKLSPIFPHESLSLTSDQDNACYQFDLGNALIFLEFPEDSSKLDYYNAFLDILALRISFERNRFLCEKSLVNRDDYHLATILAINNILFMEDGFRYPVKKHMFSKEYSLLSSVIDRKFGVCLGVSSLYLILAQRLGLPLEVITPPGHIYLRYVKDDGSFVNIETTAGGKHLPTEYYYDYDDSVLKLRTDKEMIGLTWMNVGSFALHHGDYNEALEAYVRANVFLNDDELKELIGVVMILKGNTKKGIKVLNNLPKDGKYSLAEDFLKGNVDYEGLRLLLSHPDSNTKALELYAQNLENYLHKYKFFKEGRKRLASIYYHLNKKKLAKDHLEFLLNLSLKDIDLLIHLCSLSIEVFDCKFAEKYI